jgi:hypothetical protein
MTQTPEKIKRLKAAVVFKLWSLLVFLFEDPFYPILLTVMILWLAEGVAVQSGWATCPVH